MRCTCGPTVLAVGEVNGGLRARAYRDEYVDGVEGADTGMLSKDVGETRSM